MKPRTSPAPGATPDYGGLLAPYPSVLTKRHMAVLFGCTVRCIEQQLARGAFPIPRLAWMRTAAWGKGRVRQFFECETFAPPPARKAR